MPNFNMQASRAANTIAERTQSSGSFKPFLPSIYWKGADDEKYILILNKSEDMVRLKFHPYINTESGPRSITARTSEGIGEKHDPIEDKWGYTPRDIDIAIAVELEPVFEVKKVNGRSRNSVAGFEVKTKTIERRVRDDEGHPVDDEKEEVVIPLVGYIAQSPFSFTNKLISYENSDNPIHLTPFKITQVGAGSGKQYSLQGYPDVPFDLDNLLTYLSGVSYIDDLDAVLDAISDLEQIEAGNYIGRYLLELKLEELADPDIYEEILADITQPSKYSKKGEHKAPAARPTKPSQIRRKATATAPPVKEEPDEGDEVDETTVKPPHASSGKKRIEEIRASIAKRKAATV